MRSHCNRSSDKQRRFSQMMLWPPLPMLKLGHVRPSLQRLRRRWEGVMQLGASNYIDLQYLSTASIRLGVNDLLPVRTHV